jgi:hypothetical protein
MQMGGGAGKFMSLADIEAQMLAASHHQQATLKYINN